MHQKHIPENWMRKKSWQPKKMENLYFLWQMVQQNYQEETTNSKNPLWDGNPPLGERISAENLTAIGKSFDLKNKKTTQKIGNNFGLFKDTSFIVIILNREFNLRAERRIIPYFQDLYYWTKLLREEIWRCGRMDWRKAKTSEAKTNSIILILQGKDGILYLIATLRTNSFRRKDLKKALHLIAFEGESKHTLSRLAAQRICETKILQVTVKIRRVRDTLKCELGKKEVWTPNVVLISELRESRVTYGSEDSGDLSQRRMPRETEKYEEKIF